MAGLGVSQEVRWPRSQLSGDFDRADRIGEFWSYPQSRVFVELLIDWEEDRTLRELLVGMLREAERLGLLGPECQRRTASPAAQAPTVP